MDKHLVIDYIKEIIEEVEEARSESGDVFIDGKMLAYSEVLSKLQRILIAESPDAPVEYGLGFDVDGFIFTGTRKQLDWI